MENNKKLVSIIIPTYNVEKYLQRCLESVVNQTYKNVEIVVVNDGSTDNTESIIKRYEKKFPNIKYFKRENRGVSDARNYGITHASGEYFCFVDADDYVSESLISDLERYMDKEYDLIKYKFSTINADYERVDNCPGPTFDELSGEEAFNTLYGIDTMIQPPWLYLYKMSFWKENNFEYPVGMVHEDFGRTVLIMLKAKRMVSTAVYGYFYYQSRKSITRGTNQQYNMSKAMDMLEHYEYMLKKIEDYNISINTKKNVKSYYANCLILKTDELQGEYRASYLETLKKNKVIDNIRINNIKQLIKKIILKININLYLKLR